MAGTIKTQVQLGDSATATQNFTLTSAAADGTMKLSRGNAGATTQDIMTVNAAGQVAFPLTTNTQLGVGQTWQNVSGSRVLGTTYTNTTGKPIVVSVSGTNTALGTQGLSLSVSGLVVATVAQNSGATTGYSVVVSAVIPVSATYSVVLIGVSQITTWAELR